MKRRARQFGFAPARARGFTLAEALAALLLVAIVLPVALNGISLGVRAARDARQRVQAVSLAQSKLAELVATAQWQGTELAGDFTEPIDGLTGELAPGYTWEAVVEDWEEPGVMQVTVTVNWVSHETPQRVSVATLVAGGGL